MFNKKMKAWLVVGALAAVLAVSGCGGNGDKAKSGDAAKSGVPSIIRGLKPLFRLLNLQRMISTLDLTWIWQKPSLSRWAARWSLRVWGLML